METIVVKVEFDDDREYPVRIFTVVGEVTIGITHCKGTRDTPGATKHKFVSADISVKSFNEDGDEVEVDVDDEWKQRAYDVALSNL